MGVNTIFPLKTAPFKKGPIYVLYIEKMNAHPLKTVHIQNWRLIEKAKEEVQQVVQDEEDRLGINADDGSDSDNE